MLALSNCPLNHYRVCGAYTNKNCNVKIHMFLFRPRYKENKIELSVEVLVQYYHCYIYLEKRAKT